MMGFSPKTGVCIVYNVNFRNLRCLHLLWPLLLLLPQLHIPSHLSSPADSIRAAAPPSSAAQVGGLFSALSGWLDQPFGFNDCGTVCRLT